MSRTSIAMMLRRSWEWSGDRIADRVQVAAVVVVVDGAAVGVVDADTMDAVVDTAGMGVTAGTVEDGRVVVCGRKFAWSATAGMHRSFASLRMTI